MSAKKIDASFYVTLACLALLAAAAGFASLYASRQSSRSMTRSLDEAMASPSRRSDWTTLREGAVLGRSLGKKGPASYLVVAHLPDGSFRSVASVDEDGSLLGVFPLAGSKGFAYTKRFGVLFSRIVKGGAGIDTSPLDPSLRLLIIDTLETITRLERQRTEGPDGDRR